MLEAQDFLLQIFDCPRIDAAERLVEKNQLRVGDQGAGDFKLASFSAAERVGFLIAAFQQAILIEKLIGSPMALGPAQAGEMVSRIACRFCQTVSRRKSLRSCER